MPETSIEIRVSQREIDRPRLIEAVARGLNGVPLPGVTLRLRIGANGSFSEEEGRTERIAVTSAGGSAYFQWYEWPRQGPGRDFTSTVYARWDAEHAYVSLQDMHE